MVTINGIGIKELVEVPKGEVKIEGLFGAAVFMELSQEFSMALAEIFKAYEAVKPLEFFGGVREEIDLEVSSIIRSAEFMVMMESMLVKMILHLIVQQFVAIYWRPSKEVYLALRPIPMRQQPIFVAPAEIF
jgi:hypothetical protein